MAGDYDLQLWGLGEDVLAAWSTSTFESGFESYLGAGENRSFSFNVNPVPEPSTFALVFSGGLIMAAGHVLRKRRPRQVEVAT